MNRLFKCFCGALFIIAVSLLFSSCSSEYTIDKTAVASVSLNKSELSLPVGSSETLIANVLPSTAINKSVTWSSSDSSIATVSSSGTVTAQAAGTATITASAGGKSATCTVTVTQPVGGVPDAVDLGLSVKWASFNVGAAKPEEFGYYSAWGETEAKSTYSWSTYKFGKSSWGPFSKYNTQSSYGTVDNKTVLDLEDDVAHVKLGGKWRMPTYAEWTELIEQCTWTWTDNYNGTGVAGRIVTSKKAGYTDKSIFLPATGYPYDTNLSYAGSCGFYWSSSLDAGVPYLACLVYFYSDGVRRDYFNRYYGFSVRPVSE